ncbi:MAG TPA: GH1 family beta-glucosidase [Alphaproteobacteria bacterium]|nr:GH1 family beta-glucosidase [Alphaproteobacteria bacterium]
MQSPTLSRRTLMQAAAALGLTLGAGGLPARAAGAAAAVRTFPEGFLWGASAAAYQIEGAAKEDGRGPSVWDTFSRIPGKVANGDTGDVATDHYHRYAEDVALMRDAGFKVYRGSIAWPRVLPEGTGAVNAKGLDFYDRLTDALLAAGIEFWPCLYHWDLPQALQDRGGWTNRDIAGWFADYAEVMAKRLGDRVRHWVMLNEPSVVAMFGHGFGGHAPDLTGRANFFAAIHHQNLAQGRALQVLRGMNRDFVLGTVNSVQPVRAASESEADRKAAAMWDAVWNRSTLDPLLKGGYPDQVQADIAPLLKEGDLATIAQKIDFLGLNYYSRMVQKDDPAGLFGTNWAATSATEYTAMGWPIEPDGLYEQLLEFRDRYDNLPVYITENGAAFDDKLVDGRVDDPQRVAFLRDHLAAVARAAAEGCNVRGYFVWSLLDNFEWAFGYAKRFGIVYVDYPTLKRIPKTSYRFLTEVAKANALPG